MAKAPQVAVQEHEGGWFINLAPLFQSEQSRAFNVRIVGIGEKPANQFQANRLNFRTHPQTQRDAISEILEKFGMVSGVIELSSGQLLDGHERLWQYLARGEDTPVPYLQIDMDQDDADDLLIVYDRVGELVTINKDSLASLIGNTRVTEATPALSNLIRAFAEEAKIVPASDGDGSDGNGSPGNKGEIECPECGCRFVPKK